MNFSRSITLSNYLLALGLSSGIAQNPEWITYDTTNSGINGNDLTCLATDTKGNIWIGSNIEGLCVFDGNIWKKFDFSNSPLPGNMSIMDIYNDKDDNIWVGTFGAGLFRYDGFGWTNYNTSNSGISFDVIMAITVDNQKNLWLGTGTYDSTLIKYDGNTWTTFSESNSPVVGVEALATDDQGNVWASNLNEGLLMYDGISWTIYDAGSGFPPTCCSVWDIAFDPGGKMVFANGGGGLILYDGITWTRIDRFATPYVSFKIFSVAIESDGTKWLGEDALSGLIRYDSVNWKNFTTSNSGIAGNRVSAVIVDKYDNKWVADRNYGLSVYKEGGVILSDNTETDDLQAVVKLFPNPVTNQGAFEYYLPKDSYVKAELYNAQGRVVALIIDEKKAQGSHTQYFDFNQLAAGIYLYNFQTGSIGMSGKLTIVGR